MKKQEIELLSPAGSYEGFEAAIGAGADAVYVGGPDFGARAYAQNFTQEELIRAIRTAHIHGRKLYLTVNTLLKNREIREKLFDSLKPLYEAGLDAVIVQDLGVFQFIRRNFPDMHIHASTQMAVTGPEGMKFLEEQGAARVVAARELSLEELAAMHKKSSIEIEAFVHGALCYSLSGQCLMSSILGGRSGNRGRCAQPCRLPYQVRKGEDRKFPKTEDLCPLSLKDICTLDILLEGQLGSLKDPDHGIYPMVTSSSTLAAYGAIGAGIPPYEIKQVITVCKAYSSAVGAGAFVSEIFGEEADELRRRGGDGGEYGATTGRPRRMGWFDCVASKYGCRMQGTTDVAFTVLDVLGYLDEIPVCTGYEIDGKVTTEFPTTGLLEKAKPVLEVLPGWKTDIRGIKNYEDLPENCRKYVEFVEKQIGFPITMISNGPGRNDIIYRNK